MMTYVLDTSALLTFVENEEGSDQIAALLQKALDNEVQLRISVVSCIEVFYISQQEQGEAVARRRLELLKNLPVSWESLDEALIVEVAQLKATKTMSFADCCIAALAKVQQAILVHKDPEFEQAKDQIAQLKLPYKRRRK